MAYRLLIVDDSPYYRLRFSKIFSRSTQLEVAGVAEDGDVAIRRIYDLRPDIILLDLMMPNLDGFGVLRWVMANRPMPVVVCSSYGDRERVFKALELGAIDFLLKPTPRATKMTSNLEDRIIQRVEDAAVAKTPVQLGAEPDRKADWLAAEQAAYGAGVELICIAASTGGPAAIQRLVAELPRNLSVPIVVAQHMPEGFTRPFAARLDSLSHYKVVEARDGEQLKARHIYIAPAGLETKVHRNGESLSLSVSSCTACSHAPSADALFISAAEAIGDRTLAVVLTGMGQDGAGGAEEIKRAGGHIIVESNESAIVFGMPRSVIERGCASAMLPLWSMAPVLLAYSLKD